MSKAQLKTSIAERPDPYTISEGSLVLSNKLNIRDAVELAQCELVLTCFRRQQGLPQGDYSWDHLQDIHHHLFQDVYSWAGEARTVDLKSSTGFDYASPAKISQAMEVIFAELKQDNYLLGATEEEFFNKASYYYSRMNSVHPFRTGNGRVIRTFIESLAMNNGLEFNWKNINRRQWHEASVNAVKGDRSMMTECFKAVTQEMTFGKKDEAAQKVTVKESQSAAEQAIKLMTKSMKSGKGVGSSFSPEDHSDLSTKSSGMDMS